MAQTKHNLITETLAYVTAEHKANTDPRYIVAGSQNVLIDQNRRCGIRQGTKRLGVGSTNVNPIRRQLTWTSSTGQRWKIRVYDDELEVWISTLDSTVVDTWTRVMNSLSTTEIPRFAPVWKDSETLDVLLFVQGDANLYEWSGAVAVVSSVDTNTITKAGTTTWGQNRFFATANQTLVNPRTGNEHTYTGGEGTTTLTGLNNTTGIIAGDILIQKVVTHTNEPASGRNNHTIGVFENHVLVGSNDDNEVYMTDSSDFTDTTFSAPRVAGEGGLFTLDGNSRGFGKLGQQLALFAGDDSVFRVLFKEIAVSTTLAEILDTKKIITGAQQGSMGADTIVQIGDAIAYLSNEPALRFIQDPEQLSGADPQTFSNPIKPDFDGETWTNANAFWFRNSIYISAPVSSKVYILAFVEDADGRVRRFWQAPQVLAVRDFSELDGKLYGGSNAVEETHELFEVDTYSDIIANGNYGNPDDKVPIIAKAAYSYNSYGQRMSLKTFDEYAVEGEIRQNTDVVLDLNYDFGGSTDVVQRIIEGDDSDIIEETLLNASLGQSPLGQNPIGGVLSSPPDAALFSVIFEIAKEDFRKMQPIFSSDSLDAFWTILSHGPNVELSRRKPINIRK